MNIEIDFDVFKALTALRESESDSYNAVIRRLLKLPGQANASARSREPSGNSGASGRSNALLTLDRLAADNPMPRNALLDALGGIWFGNTHFPDGTQFRATYKGRTYLAEIKDGQWVGQDGSVRTSPSDAACAISGTNVNGWRFWFAKRPEDAEWSRMDHFKQ